MTATRRALTFILSNDPNNTQQFVWSKRRNPEWAFLHALANDKTDDPNEIRKIVAQHFGQAKQLLPNSPNGMRDAKAIEALIGQYNAAHAAVSAPASASANPMAQLGQLVPVSQPPQPASTTAPQPVLPAFDDQHFLTDIECRALVQQAKEKRNEVYTKELALSYAAKLDTAGISKLVSAADASTIDDFLTLLQPALVGSSAVMTDAEIRLIDKSALQKLQNSIRTLFVRYQKVKESISKLSAKDHTDFQAAVNSGADAVKTYIKNNPSKFGNIKELHVLEDKVFQEVTAWSTSRGYELQLIDAIKGITFDSTQGNGKTQLAGVIAILNPANTAITPITDLLKAANAALRNLLKVDDKCDLTPAADTAVRTLLRSKCNELNAIQAIIALTADANNLMADIIGLNISDDGSVRTFIQTHQATLGFISATPESLRADGAFDRIKKATQDKQRTLTLINDLNGNLVPPAGANDKNVTAIKDIVTKDSAQIIASINAYRAGNDPAIFTSENSDIQASDFPAAFHGELIDAAKIKENQLIVGRVINAIADLNGGNENFLLGFASTDPANADLNSLRANINLTRSPGGAFSGLREDVTLDNFPNELVQKFSQDATDRLNALRLKSELSKADLPPVGDNNTQVGQRAHHIAMTSTGATTADFNNKFNANPLVYTKVGTQSLPDYVINDLGLFDLAKQKEVQAWLWNQLSLTPDIATLIPLMPTSANNEDAIRAYISNNPPFSRVPYAPIDATKLPNNLIAALSAATQQRIEQLQQPLNDSIVALISTIDRTLLQTMFTATPDNFRRELNSNNVFAAIKAGLGGVDIDTNYLSNKFVTELQNAMKVQENIHSIKETISKITDLSGEKYQLLMQLGENTPVPSEDQFRNIVNYHRSGSNQPPTDPNLNRLNLFKSVGNVDFDGNNLPGNSIARQQLREAAQQQKHLVQAMQAINGVTNSAPDVGKRLLLNELARAQNLDELLDLIEKHKRVIAAGPGGVPPATTGLFAVFAGTDLSRNLGNVRATFFPNNNSYINFYTALKEFAASKSAAIKVNATIEGMTTLNAQNKAALDEFIKGKTEFNAEVIRQAGLPNQGIFNQPLATTALNDLHANQLVALSKDRNNALLFKKGILDLKNLTDPHKTAALKQLAQASDLTRFQTLTDTNKATFNAIAQPSLEAISALDLQKLATKHYYQLLAKQCISEIPSLDGGNLALMDALATAANADAFRAAIDQRRAAPAPGSNVIFKNDVSGFPNALTADNFLGNADAQEFQELKRIAIQRRNELLVLKIINEKPFERITDFDPILSLTAHVSLREALMTNPRFGIRGQLTPTGVANEPELTDLALERIKAHLRTRHGEKHILNKISKVTVADESGLDALIAAGGDTQRIQAINDNRDFYGIANDLDSTQDWAKKVAEKAQLAAISRKAELKIMGVINAVFVSSSDQTANQNTLISNAFMRSMTMVGNVIIPFNATEVRDALRHNPTGITGLNPDHLSDASCEAIYQASLKQVRLLQGEKQTVVDREVLRAKWIAGLSADQKTKILNNIFGTTNDPGRLEQYKARIADLKLKIDGYVANGLSRDSAFEAALDECIKLQNQLYFAFIEKERLGTNPSDPEMRSVKTELDNLKNIFVSIDRQQGEQIYFSEGTGPGIIRATDKFDSAPKTEEETKAEIERRVTTYLGSAPRAGGAARTSVRDVQLGVNDKQVILLNREIKERIGGSDYSLKVSSVHRQIGNEHIQDINWPDGALPNVGLVGKAGKKAFYMKWAWDEFNSFCKLAVPAVKTSGTSPKPVDMIIEGKLPPELVKYMVLFAEIYGQQRGVKVVNTVTTFNVSGREGDAVKQRFVDYCKAHEQSIFGAARDSMPEIDAQVAEKQKETLVTDESTNYQKYKL
jgi:hypothetical protein